MVAYSWIKWTNICSSVFSSSAHLLPLTPAALTLRLSAHLFHFCSSDLPSGLQKIRLIDLRGRKTLNKLNYCKCSDRCYLGCGCSRPELPTFSPGDHHHVLVLHQHVLDLPHWTKANLPAQGDIPEKRPARLAPLRPGGAAVGTWNIRIFCKKKI